MPCARLTLPAGQAGSLALPLAPALAVLVLLLALVVGGAGVTPAAGCGAGGPGVGDGTLTAEQMGNARTIVTVTAARGLGAYAAIVAVAAAFTESRLINDLTQHDHDSIGLFQIRVGLHGADVAADPARATGWFLDALIQVPGWQSLPLTDAAAAVELPAAPLRGRYAAAQPLAAATVGVLWPAAAAAGPAGPAQPGTSNPADTAGAGGPAAGQSPDDDQLEAGCPPAGPAGGAATSTVPCSVGGTGQVVAAPGDVAIRVCAVGPLVVDTTIAARVHAMLTAAAADGITLGGGGYRSNAQQIILRRAHCGTSNYDVFQRPSSECSPPTAAPGTSQHEWGLAVDLTSSGHLIRSHADPAWQWLSAHAAGYGLRNLPVEPWHWSTSGR